MVELHSSMRAFVQSKGGDPDKLPNPVSTDFRLAWDAAVDAMDSVACAEGYVQKARMRADFIKKSAEAASAAAKEQQQKHAAEQDLAKKQRSAELNKKRHEKRDLARSLVLADWESDINRFPSAERAGSHYVNWLEDLPGKNLKFAQRTVRDWILERAAELKVKWK
jgi:hypothetical protein